MAATAPLKARPTVAAIILLGLLSACSGSGGVYPGLTEAERHDLLSGAGTVLGSGAGQVTAPDILGVSPPMRRFLESRIAPALPQQQRLEALVEAVISEPSFGLQYGGETRTAAETFDHRNGNCLAFTNMFVAMARHLGLNAYFQEVDVPPAWDLEGGTLVLNRHVNVNVQNIAGAHLVMRTATRRRETTGRVVDFNAAEYRSFYRSRIISDQRGFAHYFSNIGVDRLQAGAQVEALAYFKRALELDPGFAPAWTNIGVLYSWAGEIEAAEAAYRQSLALDDSVSTKYNLAVVLARAGKNEEASRLRHEVQSYRRRNPYLRYQDGLKAFESGDPAAAEAHLRFAIEHQPEEHTFHLAMGVVLLSQQRTREAENHFLQAQELAQDPAVKQRYSAKIRQLGLAGIASGE